ncbi:Uncharacterised protein [Legionella steigerwaltii]|uniref:Uncharacterized protein n=1 Tax=Legionella steigerwaltii TaxID=460 RepID=A0A378LE26_9GAMM|nr:hypothetical protein [Legionella steigerwaltii]KTD70285.1 hypothetical protein Lstg_3287 [Legionella steigerwaltii]STY24019.1 Uncharacterised protein [Legionella steigerwaltii]
MSFFKHDKNREGCVKIPKPQIGDQACVKTPDFTSILKTSIFGKTQPECIKTPTRGQIMSAIGDKILESLTTNRP